MSSRRKTVIIGGVAGGASCAARLRRLDPDRDIIVFERGDYISYANCGLPYHISEVIQDRAKLLLMTPEKMFQRFNIDVRVKNEVLSIDRANKTVRVCNAASGNEYDESYDDLVIATGSSPLRPAIPGIDSPKVLTIWTVPDTDIIKKRIAEENVRSAIVIGGGFIGLEMAENLLEAGLNVSLVEAADQVMAPLDYEMAQLLHENIRSKGVRLYLSNGVASFEDVDNLIRVKLADGTVLEAEMVILSIGIRPNSKLAKEAGLRVSARGNIIVDDQMRTEDPSIYAVGDVIEVEDFTFKNKIPGQLAGPANKQGRIVADVLAGRDSTYKRTQGSSVVKVFDLTVAFTGHNEKSLSSHGLEKSVDYKTLIITQNSHAGYYPGATHLTIKLLFSADGERIFGAQIVGKEGVDKRIDTIGVAIRLGAGVGDLKDLELAYAPPYSSAKDPVNMAGFVAENILTGLVEFSSPTEDETDADAVVLDVREPAELVDHFVPGAVNIPLGQLRNRLSELNKDKHYIIMCAVGVRAYNAARILSQNGFEHVKVYPAGIRFYEANHPGLAEYTSSKGCPF